MNSEDKMNVKVNQMPKYHKVGGWNLFAAMTQIYTERWNERGMKSSWNSLTAMTQILGHIGGLQNKQDSIRIKRYTTEHITDGLGWV